MRRKILKKLLHKYLTVETTDNNIYISIHMHEHSVKWLYLILKSQHQNICMLCSAVAVSVVVCGVAKILSLVLLFAICVFRILHNFHIFSSPYRFRHQRNCTLSFSVDFPLLYAHFFTNFVSNINFLVEYLSELNERYIFVLFKVVCKQNTISSFKVQCPQQ